jgi:hypothetical protein
MCGVCLLCTPCSRPHILRREHYNTMRCHTHASVCRNALQAAKYGMHAVMLTVMNHNAAARAFYSTLGYATPPPSFPPTLRLLVCTNRHSVKKICHVV